MLQIDCGWIFSASQIQNVLATFAGLLIEESLREAEKKYTPQ
jgi:hypothetical protein